MKAWSLIGILIVGVSASAQSIPESTPTRETTHASRQSAHHQRNDWEVVRALKAGQRVQVAAHGKATGRGDFQCATADLLVISRGTHTIYVERLQVQSVATVSKAKRSYKRTLIGVAVGIPWGLGVAINGGLKGVPITMGLFGAIGALLDSSSHENRHLTEHIVTVYAVP